MSIQKQPKLCVNHGQVLAQREAPNHVLHLLLSLVTLGLWLVVWLLVSMKHNPWVCPYCGSEVGITQEERGERRGQMAMFLILVGVFAYLYVSHGV